MRRWQSSLLNSRLGKQRLPRLANIPRLVQLLSCSDGRCRWAVECLCCISAVEDPTVAEAICSAGAVPRLVQLLSSGNVIMQECAACTLGNIARDKAGAEACAAAGGIDALLQCLCTSSNEWVQAAAAGTVRNLADVLEAAFPQPGCVPSLVRLLRSSSDEEVLQPVAAALANLFRYIPCCAAAGAAAGCIPRLVQLMGSSSNQSVRQLAVEATSACLWAAQTPQQQSRRQAAALRCSG